MVNFIAVDAWALDGARVSTAISFTPSLALKKYYMASGLLLRRFSLSLSCRRSIIFHQSTVISSYGTMIISAISSIAWLVTVLYSCFLAY